MMYAVRTWQVTERCATERICRYDVYGSMLSFDTPKEETMQDVAQFVQLAQTLCYDLARAEKATDGKKRGSAGMRM